MSTNEKIPVIVIMAGGSGTRLWPLSRKSKPKQFHAFLSEKTLLEETFDRAKRIVPESRIFISTGEHHVKTIGKILPKFDESRLIIEPFPRGTTPAIALVSAVIGAIHPGAIIATLASDHAIENENEFARSISAAFETVSGSPDKLVTIGINPTRPDTGLGYIKLGREFGNHGNERVFFVDAFKEKPDRATAEKYLMDFECLWNAGYFIFSADAMSGWIEAYAPELSRVEKMIREKASTGLIDADFLEKIYADAPESAIEPAIVEKLPVESRLVIPAPIRWSDVGSWDTLYEFLGRESAPSGNVSRGSHIELDSRGNLVISDRLVATLGTKNLVIVDTDDALLVARRDKAHEMKKLVEELKKRGLEHFL